MKQETLEEVIGRQFQFNSSSVIKDEKPVYLINKHSFKIAVDNILKWQQERSYSEEEVDKLLDTLLENNMCSIAGNELIQEFKNK